jgi:hypothetical protein
METCVFSLPELGPQHVAHLLVLQDAVFVPATDKKKLSLIKGRHK